MSINEPDDTMEYDMIIYFVECTCNHDREEHDWDRCQVEGCKCEGHWEE